VTTLSDRPGLGATVPRTARVWQPLDLLHPSAGHGGFVRQAWSDRPLQSFDLQVVKTWSPPEDAAVDETTEVSLADAALPVDAVLSEEAVAEATLALTEAALETVRQTAYAEGLAAGQQQVREEWNADQKLKQSTSQNILLNLESAVRRLINTPAELFEPMKRLALHLAEQLVLAELTLSPQAIERLVRRSIDELAPQRLAPITVELNPADLAVLQPQGAAPSSAATPDGEKAKAAKPDWPWHLQANDKLLPGSVRVSASDAVVSDLIEHRLEALARSLLLETDRSSAQSAFQPSRLAARLASAQVVDAQPRMPPAPDSQRTFEEVPEAVDDEFTEPFTWQASDDAESKPAGHQEMSLDGMDLPNLNLDESEPRDA
jgi:flagellar biosynthesis/type III secretory pathway protein FliH